LKKVEENDEGLGHHRGGNGDSKRKAFSEDHAYVSGTKFTSEVVGNISMVKKRERTEMQDYSRKTLDRDRSQGSCEGTAFQTGFEKSGLLVEGLKVTKLTPAARENITLTEQILYYGSFDCSISRSVGRRSLKGGKNV